VVAGVAVVAVDGEGHPDGAVEGLVDGAGPAAGVQVLPVVGAVEPEPPGAVVPFAAAGEPVGVGVGLVGLGAGVEVVGVGLDDGLEGLDDGVEGDGDVGGFDGGVDGDGDGVPGVPGVPGFPGVEAPGLGLLGEAAGLPAGVTAGGRPALAGGPAGVVTPGGWAGRAVGVPLA